MRCSRAVCRTPRKGVEQWTETISLCSVHRETLQIQIAARQHMESMEKHKKEAS